MLNEAAPRAGFFEREQYEGVLRHLPAELQPVVSLTYITGWRMADEVLPLEWRQVDFDAGDVRLEPGTTKNKEGRTFPFTAELRDVLKAQHAEHERLKKVGHIFPQVFFREVAEGRRRQEAEGDHEPQQGVEGGVSRGRVSGAHPARHATERGAEPRARGHLRARGDDDDGPQDAQRVRALQHHVTGRPEGRSAVAERRGGALAPHPASIIRCSQESLSQFR